jgi:hypothetical protein
MPLIQTSIIKGRTEKQKEAFFKGGNRCSCREF